MMQPRHERLSFVYVSLAMLTVGTLLAETGASLGLLVRQLDLSPTQQGNLVSARFFGGVVFGLLLWIRASTISLGRWMQATLLLTVVAGALLAVEGYWAAYLGALIRGFSAGFVIPAAGVYASGQERWNAGTVAAAVNAALSAGLVAVSAFALVISGVSGVLWQWYWMAGPALAVPTLILGAMGGAAIVPLPVPPASPGQRVKKLLRGTRWRFALAAFFTVGTESVLFGLIPRLSETIAAGGTGSKISAFSWTTEQYALAVMVGVLVGRIVGTRVLRRVAASRILLISAAGLVLFGVMWSVAPPALVAVAALGFGLATANFFPALVGAVSEELGPTAPTTVASMGWTGASGGTIIPPIIGLGITVGLPVAWMGVVAVVPSVLAVAVSLSPGKNRGPAASNTEQY